MKVPFAGSPRFPAQRSSAQGESAPKVRAKAVADGNLVNIPEPPCNAIGGTEKVRQAGCWTSRFKRVGVLRRQIRAT